MLKKSSPLKHKEEGHMIMTEEAHAEAHGGEIPGADSEESPGFKTPIFNYEEFSKENNVTPTAFTGEKGIFNLDEANQIWTDSEGNIVDDADVPEEYIKQNKEKLEATIQNKGTKSQEFDSTDLWKFEHSGGGVADNTAIQNAHAFKATDEQMQSSTELADKSISKALEQQRAYNTLKKIQPSILGQFADPMKKPTAGNRKALADWNRDQSLRKQEEEKLENLKIERDKNPLWEYIVRADKKLRKGEKEDYTEENIKIEARALYLQDMQAKHLQKNVETWIDNQDGVGTSMPGSQKAEIAKNEEAVKILTEKQVQNVKEVHANKTLYEDLNNEMTLLLHGGKNKKGEEVKGFNNREDYFKEKLKVVKEQLAELGPIIKEGPLAWTKATYAKYNSIIEENRGLLNDYKQYDGEKTKFLTKFDELEGIRNAHYQNYINGVTKDQEFGEDGQDLLAYQNLMNRNGHTLTSVASWLSASGISITSGLEDTAAEIVMLPQGLRNDRMFKDNPLAQILVNKADKFEKWRGGQPILDNEGRYIEDTPGYKDNINKFTQSLHNGVQLPQLWEDCNSIEDYGAWGVNSFANFLPQMALMYVAPSASLKILATSATGHSLAHSRRSNYMGETDYSLGQRITHGLMCGTAEYYSEKVSLGLIRTAPGIVKKRFKNGFVSGVKNTLKPKSLLRSGYRSGTEGLSEVGATIFGQNAADRLAFGKNVSLYKDVPESFAAGLVMERTIAMSALAKATIQPFLGNRYDSKLKGFEKEKQDVLVDLSQEGLSESNQNDLIQKYIRVQNKQDALLAKQYENVDMMKTEEVESLIDLDVNINELNQSIENIQEDDSLSDADKDIRIRKVKQERSELETERNKIVEEYEKDETRQKRVEEFEKQKEIVDAKIAKFNKRKKESGIFGALMGGSSSVAQGESQTFETAEEQQAFFNDQISEANAEDKAEIQEMQDLLKDPNTSRSDRIDIQNSLAFLRNQIKARNQYSKTASSEYGFIGQKKDGSFKIYLNKENATKLGGNVNVAAHEFLHSVLYQTTKGDSKIQQQLGDAVIDFIGEKKGGFSNKFIEKMEPYQGEANFGEEIITVMSESILDGSLKYKEGFFTKVGDIIRQNLQRLGLKDIKFDTGKDVYNFIKDYNASIEKNYDSKAIDRMMATGAQGKLLEGRKGGSDIMQSSKEQSQKVQDIYAKKGADAAGEIAMEYGGMAEKIFERNLNNAPSEDIRNNLLRNKDIIVADILYNPGTKTAKARTVLGLVKDFETKKHKYGNVAAYINQFLPERAKEIFAPYGVEMAITKSQEQEGIKEKVAKIAAAETKKLSEDSFKGHKIHEKLGKGDVRVRKLVEDYQKKVKALAKKMPIEEVRNLKFQNVQGMGHEIIAEIMGIDAAKLDPSNTKQYHANLRKDDKKGTNEQLLSQQFMLKNPLSFKIAVPKHHTTKLVKDKKTGEMVERPHQAIGIPGSILNPYFIKGKRKDNLTPWTLDKEMMDNKKFLEPVGVIDGKSFRNDQRKSQQAILNFATLLDKTMTYQAIKEQKLEEGYTLDDTKTMSDGVSEFSFSKAVLGLNAKQTEIFYRKLPELAASVNPALEDYTKVEAMKIALEEVYGEDLPTSVKTAIAKDFVGLIKKYQNVIANNQTVNEAVWMEYIAESFNQEADNIIKMLNLQIDGKSVKYATDIYNNQQNIERGRRKLIQFGNNLVKQGKSLQEVARIMAILKPMYAGNSKIGKGMFVTDVNGKIQEISYDQLVYPKTHKTKAGQVRTEFGSPRNQIFESVEAFEEWGVMQIDGMTPEIWKNTDTKLIAQTSQAAMKDRDFNGRLAEAKEARQVIDDMMTFLNKEGNDLDVAMFMISNLSNMDAPLRRAANLQYIADAVLGMKNIGKNAEYEHMIPANYMALKIIDQYKNKGGIKNQDNFYKNYNVAIIPKTMDDVLKLQGLQSKMMPGYNFEIDPSTGRYYNFLTKGFEDIVSIRDINTNDVIGPTQFSKRAAKAKILGDAVQFSRKINKPRGITVLDFDDTLATTKSGVKARIPNPDGTPKPKRKVIFLAGGAGSGKSNVVNKLGLEDQGFKIVNQDISLEWLKKNSGLPANMNDLTKEQRSTLGKLQHQARGIAKRKMMKYQGNADGVVVDGTGGSLNVMRKQVQEFKDKGYDVSMLFTETSLDVALERNKARKERSLLDKIVKKNHESVQGNKDGFKTMFGGRFMEVNTNKLSLKDAMPSKLTNEMNDFVSSYENRRLDAEEFASEGAGILERGGTFDFSEFNKVVEGQTAPLFEKAMKLQSKFGNKDMFVLTARPAKAAQSIFEFLQANGLNIPLKNITGLANSTPEAKALWMAEKVGEGYNDFYFADDALQNVQAVQNMLDQFDVKSKVQQAKIQFSKSMNQNFNDILENVTGIESGKRFSAIKARKRGADKGKFRFFIPPSHEDFVGLLYNFMGKGKEGNAHRDFWEKALVRPLNRAYRELNTAKQSIANDFKSLGKRFPDVKKKLTKKTPDGDFTHQDAVRVYLWNKHGHKVPGLSPTDQTKLTELVMSDPSLQTYAETLNVISKQDAYVKPGEGWEAGDIRTDLDDATGRVGRAEYFTEFQENADIIFSEENLNKIEAAYGADVVSAIKDILYRTKTGRNRPSGQNKLTNGWLNYLNGSVAATMFFNIRSSVLQQMSMVNFINFGDNNILAAAKAFANQKQYYKDWATIFNSDFMKQRRGGIKTDINGAELAASLRGARNTPRALLAKLLELGFLPTQIGDNVAIATGGATFYRNRINTYTKQGMSQKEAESKAWTDFQILAEATQQSARPDMVSQQQASPLGKIILAFQNVTSQFNRLGKKAFLDIKNRRITPGNATQLQSDMSNASRIAYYFAIQNVIFYSLQTALFSAMFDDDEDDERMLAKKERVINGTLDSILRGSGVWGAVISTLKNMAIAYHKEREKDWNGDEASVLVEALNVSPPLGIKARKIVNAERTLNYNKSVMGEMETFDIENPQWSANTSYIEALTNIPLNRLYNKTLNIRQSLNNQHNALQRVLMFSGWSQWNLGIGDSEKIEEVKETIKEKKKIITKKKQKIKKEEKKKQVEEENKVVIEENKKKSKKDGICSAISKGGKRCKSKAVNGGFCTVHEKAEQNETGKQSQCKKIKKGGKRCGMQTSSKSGYCYYHD